MMTEPISQAAKQAPEHREKIIGHYCVVMPAFNAADTVGGLARRVKEIGLTAVVVDDGSTDKTAEAASKSGAIVISHLHNQGKGHALQTGFEYARRMGFDGVVTLDSDGQHDPEEIVRLIHAGEVQHAGIVLGNRMEQAQEMPRLRLQTNRLMSAIVSAITRQKIPDSQCGLRMIRREVLENIPVKAKRFEVETELLLKAAAKKWKIVSVSIRTIYPQGQRSHIKPVRDGLRFIGLIVKHVLLG